MESSLCGGIVTAIDTLREGMHLQPAHVSLSLRLVVAAEAQAQRVALAHVSLLLRLVVAAVAQAQRVALAHVSLSLRPVVAAVAQAQRVALAHVPLSSQCLMLWLLWKSGAIPGCGGGRRVQKSETQGLSNSVSRVKNHLHCTCFICLVERN